MKIEEQDLAILITAVERINDEMTDKRGYPKMYEAPILSITLVPASKKWSTVGFVAINLSITGGQEFQLYRSDEDDRIYNELKDTYESWYKYVRRKWKLLRNEYLEITL